MSLIKQYDKLLSNCVCDVFKLQNRLESFKTCFSCPTLSNLMDIVGKNAFGILGQSFKLS